MLLGAYHLMAFSQHLANPKGLREPLVLVRTPMDTHQAERLLILCMSKKYLGKAILAHPSRYCVNEIQLQCQAVEVWPSVCQISGYILYNKEVKERIST